MSLNTIHSNKFDYIIASSDFVKKSYIEAVTLPIKIYLANFDIDFSRFDVKSLMIKQKILKCFYGIYDSFKGLLLFA